VRRPFVLPVQRYFGLHDRLRLPLPTPTKQTHCAEAELSAELPFAHMIQAKRVTAWQRKTGNGV